MCYSQKFFLILFLSKKKDVYLSPAYSRTGTGASMTMLSGATAQS